MSTRQRVERTFLSVCALASAVFFTVILIGLVSSGGMRDQLPINLALWGSAVATLVFSVAACRVEDDSTGEPSNLHTFVDGLRNEWRRHNRAA